MSVRERQIPDVFTHMWTLTGGRGARGEGKSKNSYKQKGREANRKKLLNTEKKLRVNGQGGMGDGHRGGHLLG